MALRSNFCVICYLSICLGKLSKCIIYASGYVRTSYIDTKSAVGTGYHQTFDHQIVSIVAACTYVLHIHHKVIILGCVIIHLYV